MLMKEELSEIKILIDKGDAEGAISALSAFISHQDNKELKSEAFYLLGNVHRKRGDWQMALNNYLEAIELNPQSPAVHAKQMLMDILNFYNKDMYNQ